MSERETTTAEPGDIVEFWHNENEFSDDGIKIKVVHTLTITKLEVSKRVSDQSLELKRHDGEIILARSSDCRQLIKKDGRIFPMKYVY